MCEMQLSSSIELPNDNNKFALFIKGVEVQFPISESRTWQVFLRTNYTVAQVKGIHSLFRYDIGTYYLWGKHKRSR